MSDGICDPYAGWHGIGHEWAHCRGDEDECLTVELLSVGSGYAYVGTERSWEGREGIFINSGSYHEYQENGRWWRIYCDGVVTSMEQANIRICYEDVPGDPDPEDGMREGDSRTIGTKTFTITKIICTPTQQITAYVEGLSTSIKLGAFAVFPGPFVSGAIYIGLKSVSAACDSVIIQATEGGLSQSDIDDIDAALEASYTNPDGTTPTAEEIHEVKMGVIDGLDYTDGDFTDLVEQLLNGEITRETFIERVIEYVTTSTESGLNDVFYTGNFSLSIPAIVMAGDVDVAGTAPQQNQIVKIMAVNTFLGVDWWAGDTELASPISDSEYEFAGTIPLEEFGIVEVYATIGKDWWEILDEDIETEHHTVLVLTWTMLVAILAILAMVLDKKYNFIGMFNKRGKK